MDVTGLLEGVLSNGGDRIARSLLERFPFSRCGGSLVLTVTEELANAVLEKSGVGGIEVRMGDGVVVVRVTRKHIWATASLQLADWRFDRSRGVIRLRCVKGVQTASRDFVGRVVLMAMRLLWRNDFDNKVFRSVAASLNGVGWADDMLECDLDRIPQVHEWLRLSLLGTQLLDLVTIEALVLEEGRVRVVMALNDQWKWLAERT